MYSMCRKQLNCNYSEFTVTLEYYIDIQNETDYEK